MIFNTKWCRNLKNYLLLASLTTVSPEHHVEVASFVQVKKEKKFTCDLPNTTTSSPMRIIRSIANDAELTNEVKQVLWQKKKK
jgi:hypothetical protein